MPATKNQEKPPKKETWKTESLDGALLFLLLHLRIAGTPDDFSASEIQQNPEYPFDKYSAATFKRNSQTVANKAKQFEKKGTGLSKKFKGLIAEVLKENAELFEDSDTQRFEEEEEEEEEEYVPEEEEDIPLDADEEASLSDRFHPRSTAEPPATPQPPIDKSNIISGARRKPKKAAKTPAPKQTTSTSEAPTMSTKTEDFDNHLVSYPDGRVMAVTRLASGWDGTIRLDDSCKKVIKRTYFSKSLFDAQSILQRHGLDDNNIHIATLQACMDKKIKAAKAKSKKPGESASQVKFKDLYDDEVLFELPFQVRDKFVDVNGNESNDVMIEADNHGTEWAYMFMVGVHAREVEQQAPRIVRNRNRGRTGPQPQPRPAPSPPAAPPSGGFFGFGGGGGGAR